MNVDFEASDAAYKLHCEASRLRLSGENEEAAAKWAECVALVPDEAAYLREYADCLARLLRWEEDLHYASLAAAFDPTHPEAWGLMGAACGFLGRHEDAKRYYDRAESLAPLAPSVMFNRSLFYLLHGDYARGWRDYEWRVMIRGTRRTLRECWGGQPIPGRTLFVWSEQGFGDTLQFVRFVKRAKERSGARVVLEVQRELLTLLHGQDLGADEVVTQGSSGSVPFEDFEHVSLMSLPFVLGIDEEREFWSGAYLRAEEPTSRKCGMWNLECGIPEGEPTPLPPPEAGRGALGRLLADEERVEPTPPRSSAPLPRREGEEKCKRAGAGAGEPGRLSICEADGIRMDGQGRPSHDRSRRVGVCWQGSRENACDGVRSIPQEEFWEAIVAPRPEVTFVSVNPAVRLPDCPNCENPPLVSFAETAWVLRGVDLLITVDTSVAHLAGALGVPVLLLIRFATDWRWCVKHPESSPWYPSVRIVRQGAYDEGWSKVLARASEVFAELVG